MNTHSKGMFLMYVKLYRIGKPTFFYPETSPDSEVTTIKLLQEIKVPYKDTGETASWHDNPTEAASDYANSPKRLKEFG